MSALASLLVLPGVYLFLLVSLFARGKRDGLTLSLFLFALAVVVGFWSITKSRSSTAGIGVIFLPLVGSIAGLLGLAYAHWRASPDALLRGAGWLSIGAAFTLIGAQVVVGMRTIERNRQRDVDYAAQEQAIAQNRKAIADTLARSEGREPEVIDRLIRAHGDDRAFLIPALESRFVSPPLLDSLTRSGDLGVALQAVRNPNTEGATLERVYRTHTFPDYFFQALAAHPNTPPAILREIHDRPRAISGLEIWFARNPATPRDILDRIARSTRDVNVVQGLLENPALDCELLGLTAASLDASDRPDDEFARARIRELEPLHCR